MNKFLITGCIVTFISLNIHAQVTQAEKAALDSMLKADEFIKMLDSLDQPESYVDISIGIGNRLFSVKNNSVNSTQALTNKIYYTPSVAYRHKSGLSIAVMPFITTGSGSLKIYQTGLTPAYDYADEKISAGLSYTRL